MSPPANISPLRRGIAVLLAGLVLALGVLAWMPDLHARLHAAVTHSDCAQAPGSTADDAHPAAPADDSACVVTLFAQGLTTPVAPPLPLPPRTLAEITPAALPEIALPPAPDRLHPPALAPPALG